MASASTPSAQLNVPVASAMPQAVLTQMAVNSQNANDGIAGPSFAYNNGSGGIGTSFNASTVVLTTVSDGNGFTLSFTSGTSPAANLSIGVVTFAAAYPVKPIVFIEGNGSTNQAAGVIGKAWVPSTGITTTGFQINNCSGALSAATFYSYEIIVKG